MAFAKQVVAYRARALSDREYLEKLREMSRCFVPNRLDDLKQPLGLLGGYDNWYRLVDEIAIRRVDELRDSVMPLVHDDDSEKLLAQIAALPADDQPKRAELVDEGYGLLLRLREDEPRAAVATAFAGSFDDPERRAKAASMATRITQARAALETTIATELGKLRPSPESGGKEKGITRSMFAGYKGIVHARATSKLLKDRGSDTGHVEIQGVKYIYTSATEFEGFDVEYMVRDHKPYWVAIPGVPLSDLCSVYYAKARRFTKGFDRNIGGWVTAYESTARPMLCKAR